MGIIKSILDTDLYKLSMQNAILELYPDTQAEYVFINRNESDYSFNEDFLKDFQENIDNMVSLQLTYDEKAFLKSRCPFLKPSYMEYLKNYKFNPNEVIAKVTDRGQLKISVKGKWHSTVLWEVPLMAIISELYFSKVTSWTLDGQRKKAINKMDELCRSNCFFAEFGTRRRRSFETQLTVVDAIRSCPTFVGTSNVFLACKYGVRPTGTVAHEFIMAQSVLNGLRHANKFAMIEWTKVYCNADLGTALTDTYGVDSFLYDFNKYNAKLWDSVRQDSGNPFEFVDKMVKHYTELRINSMTKTIIFSDNLNVEKCIKLNEYCRDKIQCSFGIGTHFTNDFDDGKALNMVIKIKSIDGVPVVKLSEDITKAVGDRDAMRVAKWVFLGQGLD